MSMATNYTREKSAHPRNMRDERPLEPVHDALCYLREFARQKPEIAALTCLGIGFVLGWKLKPW